MDTTNDIARLKEKNTELERQIELLQKIFDLNKSISDLALRGQLYPTHPIPPSPSWPSLPIITHCDSNSNIPISYTTNK